ncbi:hypothetical protein [Latilactobacillus curvatus]|uniref:hypothetical protein n=1 Tax=Latilactobacillus curvatus TaxID=28038 RepID=UPI00280B4D04|nr:hypothetical protein [Latilactobacillus curvatus]
MLWFKKQTEKDLQSHDFTQLVKHARNDEMHYQKIQATFAGLKKAYHQPKLNQLPKKD